MFVKVTAEKERKKKCWDATIFEFSKLAFTQIFSKHTGCLNHFRKIQYVLHTLLLGFYCKAVNYFIGIPFSL